MQGDAVAPEQVLLRSCQIHTPCPNIDLWLADPADWSLADCVSTLSPAERQRADRFRHDGARSQFVLGRTLLRRQLGRRLGIRPERVTIVFEALGRPRLEDARSGLTFNLSHTNGLVVCALGRVAQLGLDVERGDREIDAEQFSATILHPEEQADFLALSGGRLRLAILTRWTLKEAYVKATGEGLSRPFREIAFSSRSPDAELLVPGTQAGPWWFRTLTPTPHFLLSLAARAPTQPGINLAWAKPDS